MSSVTSDEKTETVGGTLCERVILNSAQAPLSASGTCGPK
jgi:hypothetical protein